MRYLSVFVYLLYLYLYICLSQQLIGCDHTQKLQNVIIPSQKKEMWYDFRKVTDKRMSLKRSSPSGRQLKIWFLHVKSKLGEQIWVTLLLKVRLHSKFNVSKFS